jgi:protocatechuate 4,5-dioxygenase, alpha chain
LLTAGSTGLEVPMTEAGEHEDEQPGRPPALGAPDYADIPGTYIQDGAHTRLGYRLNMALLELNRADGRDAFRADEAAFLDRFGVTPDQRQAVLDRDWLRMLQLGANVYYLLKLTAFDRVSVQHMAGQMSGVSEADFVAMMVAGGRPITGNRTKAEWAGRAKRAPV